MNSVPARPGWAGPAIFVSPHFDDVALSCGGTVALLARRSPPPLIVTVFAGETLDEAINPFARWKHQRWGLADVDTVFARRRDEDRQAAAVLGCRSRWLGFPDAIYRGDRYGSDDELYDVAPKEAEQELVRYVAAELRSLPEWTDEVTVYVPLAVGRHIDHQLAFLAGRRLAAEGITVYAYEDCPYAIHTPVGVQERLTALDGTVGPAETVAVDETIERRIEAIGAYASQLPVIFRFTDDYGAVIRGHARRAASGGGYAERFWRVLPAPLS